MRTCGCGRRVERVRACGRWGQGRRWEAERAQRCEVFVSWAVAVVAAQLRGVSERASQPGGGLRAVREGLRRRSCWARPCRGGRGGSSRKISLLAISSTLVF
ncbi:unnamed protein product [Caretta caretta]